MSFRHLLSAEFRGDGPRTVVFGNGLATTKAAWDALLASVPDGWRVLRFDYVGTTPASANSWINERYTSYAGHADDVVRLLAECELREVLFVGHSMSGMIGALAAANAPDRIAHLLMIGASPCYRQDSGYPGGFSSSQIAELLQRAEADLAAWMGGFAPVVLGADATPRQLDDYLQALLAIRPDIGHTLLRSVFLSDYRHLLTSVPADVTIVQGTDDIAVPTAVGQYLAEHLRCRAYHELDVPGHLTHVTHPSLVAPILAATCADMDRRALPA